MRIELAKSFGLPIRQWGCPQELPPPSGPLLVVVGLEKLHHVHSNPTKTYQAEPHRASRQQIALQVNALQKQPLPYFHHPCTGRQVAGNSGVLRVFGELGPLAPSFPPGWTLSGSHTRESYREVAHT